MLNTGLMLKILTIYCLLFVLTFGGILPYFCSSWVYSIYFDKTHFQQVADSIYSRENAKRSESALQFLDSLSAEESKSRHSRLLRNDLDIVIVVTTTDRTRYNNNPETRYLTQTVTRLDQEMRSQSNTLKTGLLICNVDNYPSSYMEATELDKYYQIVIGRASRDHHLETKPSNFDVREIEKRDYMYCLQHAMQVTSKYVLMVEDDAEPYPEVFRYINRIIKEHLEGHFQAGELMLTARKWAFLKLYYPERWSGFGWEWGHFSELLGIACLVGTTFVAIARLVQKARPIATRVLWLHMLVGACYGIFLSLTIGRQHLLQIWRVLPELIKFVHAPSCCTPAVLYPYEIIPLLIEYLLGVHCHSDYGVDLALDQFADNRSLSRYLVEPNLFHHRGVYSTLTKQKDMVEFLFDV